MHYQQDTEGLDYELRYFRDRDGREVDFVVTNRGAPVLLVECKWSDADLDRGLKYLEVPIPRRRSLADLRRRQERLRLPAGHTRRPGAEVAFDAGLAQARLPDADEGGTPSSQGRTKNETEIVNERITIPIWAMPHR